MNRGYSVLLALAGLSVAFMFMLFAAISLYLASALIVKGGFWCSIAAIALLAPFLWSVFLGIGVLDRTVVRQS